MTNENKLCRDCKIYKLKILHKQSIDGSIWCYADQRMVTGKDGCHRGIELSEATNAKP